MKVIFLDFDGVINNFHNIDGINKYNVAFLKVIIKKTNAKIIATSSTKYSFQKNNLPYESTKYYQNYLLPLKEYGITIHDYTPLCNQDKETEISIYLKTHPEITEFLILDDDFISKNYKAHQVYIDLYKGISLEHVTPSINILNGNISFYPKDINLPINNNEWLTKINKYYLNSSIIYNILTKDNVVKSINENLDILLEIIEEIKPMIGFDHKHPHHHLDIWNHTLLALSMSPNDFEIRLSLLLHDIGKPHSYTEGDVRHFKNHPEISSKIARNILERLHYDKLFINKICYLIQFHDTPINDNDIQKNTELIYKRYQIQTCDALAHHPDKLSKRKDYLSKVDEKFKKLKIKNR